MFPKERSTEKNEQESKKELSAYPWRDLYKTCVALELSPSDFWAMSPDEVGEYVNSKRPMQHYGRMSEDQAKTITDRIKANPDKYI